MEVDNLTIRLRTTADGAESSVDRLSRALQRLSNASRAVGRALGRVIKQIAKTAISLPSKAVDAFKQKISAMIAPIKKLGAAVLRVGFYRLVRSAIKMVTQALEEGAENAYFFSLQFGNGTKYIAEALDSLASTNGVATNQLGAAWATLLSTIAPIMIQILNLITRVVSAITQLFAALGGKGTYLKAIDYNKKWAESAAGAGGAAKEWKNQLLGFDEINRLEEPSDGGGGGGSDIPDYEKMFEEAAVSDWINELVKNIKNGNWDAVGSALAQKVNGLVNSIDWAGWGRKIGYNINGAIAIAYRFLSDVNFRAIGEKIATFLSSTIRQINFYKLGRLFVRRFTAMWDFVIGLISKMDWAEVGKSIGEFIIGAMQEAIDWLDTLDAEQIVENLKKFFSRVDWQTISDTFAELVVKALTVFGDVISALSTEEGGFNKLLEIGGKIVSTIIKSLKEADFMAVWHVLQYQIDKALFGEKYANWYWSFGEYAGKDIIMGMINGTTGQEEELTEAGTAVGESVKSGLDATDSKASGTGLITRLIEGIKEKWPFVKKESEDNAKSWKLPWDNADMKESGQGLFSRLWEGLKEKWPSVQKDNETNAFSWKNIWDKLNTKITGQMIIQKLWNGISNKWGPLSAWMVGKPSDIITPFSAINLFTIGANIMSSLWQGLVGVWNSLASWLNNIGAQVSGWLSGIINAGNSVDSNAVLYENYGGGYAAGGFPDEGQLFMAREAGPELVGSFGGRTAVANNDQIVSGIRQGVYEAVAAAMTGSSGNSNQPVNIYMDGELIATTTTRYQKQYALMGNT